MKDTEPAEGQYVYAIIACAEPREFLARGIGERGDAVHLVNYRRIGAIVSSSPNIEYENSRRNMMAHTLVLEEIMKEFDLLPVRFGTIAPDADTIKERLLAARYQELTELLEQMRDRMELGLKAFWYDGAAIAEVVRDNETIRRMRDALTGRSTTETYYERIRLGEEVENALAQKRARDEETILDRIRPLVHKTRTNKIVSDRMVVNAAFLVDRRNGIQVDDAMRAARGVQRPAHIQIFRPGTAVQFRQHRRQLVGMTAWASWQAPSPRRFSVPSGECCGWRA